MYRLPVGLEASVAFLPILRTRLSIRLPVVPVSSGQPGTRFSKLEASKVPAHVKGVQRRASDWGGRRNPRRRDGGGSAPVRSGDRLPDGHGDAPRAGVQDRAVGRWGRLPRVDPDGGHQRRGGHLGRGGCHVALSLTSSPVCGAPRRSTWRHQMQTSRRPHRSRRPRVPAGSTWCCRSRRRAKSDGGLPREQRGSAASFRTLFRTSRPLFGGSAARRGPLRSGSVPAPALGITVLVTRQVPRFRDGPSGTSTELHSRFPGKRDDDRGARRIDHGTPALSDRRAGSVAAGRPRQDHRPIEGTATERVIEPTSR